jgi:tetratricopeptide (TPR) repeat protein
MNSFWKRLFLLGCCAGLLAAGCNSRGNQQRDDQEAILTHAPFAGITDSIRQAEAASAAPAVTAALYFTRAEYLSRNNKHELAAADFQRSWTLQPDETTGLRFSSTLMIISHTGKAIQVLKDCIRRFPSNSTFPSMLGDIYQQLGRTKEALGLYDTMLTADTANFEAWYEKGLLLEKTGDTTAAIYALGKAYTLQPINTYALELAHLYAEKKDPAALTICDRVLRKDSARELLDPLFIKGIYFSNTAQYRKAIVNFDSCIARDWKFTDAYLEKGIALFKQNNYPEAMKTFQMTVNVSNTDPDGYFWIGRCFEAIGNKDQAIQYYQQALALDKDFSEAAAGIRRLK